MHKRKLVWGISALLLLTILSLFLIEVVAGDRTDVSEDTEPIVNKAEQFVTIEPAQRVESPTTSENEKELISVDSWKLTLVNPWNPIPEPYTITTVKLKNGCSIDERCYPELQAMMDDCRAAGLSPLICSGYRTQQYQETLFNKQVNKWIAKGYSREDAEVEAGKIVAVPGTSEHQLGLAVDIVDVNNQRLDETQESTETQKWLMEHSWEYGFILRYPKGKSDVTGIIYEPWHYRYVGKEAAKEIYERGVCLEEYLAESNS